MPGRHHQARAHQDWDARYRVSDELTVVRWGAEWCVIEALSGAILGPNFKTRADAIHHAGERVQRGDYR